MKKNRIHIENNTSHLTQAELLAYGRGELGIDEMYRLEQHIIDCEFCSEALEGLDVLPTSVDFDKVIDSINQDIVPSNKANSRSWMMVAASITLILITSITFWLLNQETTPEPLAQNTEQSVATDTSENIQLSPDEEKSEVLEDNIESTETDVVTTEQATTSEPVARSEEIIADLDVDVVRQELDQGPELAAVEDQELNEIRLDLTTQDNAQAVAEVSGVTREQTEDKARSKKSMATPSAAAPDSELDTPVASTTGRAAQRETAYTNITEPSPVGGTAALRRYIRKNMIYPYLARQNNVKGEVALQITIATDGAIKAIVVTSSLGFGCDVEAIRLIENGPAWNPGLGDGNPIETTTEVKVKFRP